MGKNYTLYIKPAKFEEESNKSGLVNELLDMHYTRGGIVDMPVVNVPSVFETSPLPKSKLTSATAGNNKFCEKGHSIPAGRDRCMGKGCKYS